MDYNPGQMRTYVLEALQSEEETIIDIRGRVECKHFTEGMIRYIIPTGEVQEVLDELVAEGKVGKKDVSECWWEVLYWRIDGI